MFSTPISTGASVTADVERCAHPLLELAHPVHGAGVEPWLRRDAADKIGCADVPGARRWRQGGLPHPLGVPWRRRPKLGCGDTRARFRAVPPISGVIARRLG